MKRLILLLSTLGASCARAPEVGAAPPDRSMRAIWVTRWDYRTAEDVDDVLENAAEAGFDTVLWQVRGNATAFYRSRLEPWAAELGGEDPGFDPLARAIAGAHERGLALHAWFNVVPAWWGPTAPEDPNHVVNAHPDWLWYDVEGRRQDYSPNFYVSLNPCLPEVRGYVELVVRDLLRQYDVDGLHLDYIRFPNEPPASKPGQDFPRDRRTLELFEAETGLAPDDDAEAWDRWRAGCVTELVRRIRVARDDERSDAHLSAAVGSDPERALEHHQDWREWVDEGLLDLVFPMNYVADVTEFERRSAIWDSWKERVPVVMGLSLEAIGDEELSRRSRLAEAGFDGFAWFGYASLWDSANGVIAEQTPALASLRARRRAALLPFLAGLKGAD